MSTWFKKIKKKYHHKRKSILYFDTYGNIALASFLICAVSGIFLAIPFDVKNAYDSVALILLKDPAANFTRNIHYWSAQLFLIFSILHVWDHFNKKTEENVKKGVWLRLTISIFFIFYVMLSGFMLKGDLDSLQAKRILTALFNEIPLLGNVLSYTFLGPEGNFQIVYVHHIATATIFLIIITFEHAKTIWTRIPTALYTLTAVLIFSYFLTPSLHDQLNPIVKGPWYFLGLQELLHWISNPIWTILLVVLFFIIFYYIPKFSIEKREIVKKSIVAVFSVYILLTLFGYFFRGENWEFQWPWNNPYFLTTSKSLSDYYPEFSESETANLEIPTVLNRKEGCIVCHDKVEGFSPAHNPQAVGCASCHLGNIFTLNKEAAHKGMTAIPGELSISKRTCGTSQCHEEITQRLPKSIMSTLSGMISVDRFVFDEISTPTQKSNVELIGHSAADSHLRDLCVSCHIGGKKEEWGPNNQLSRGGGCLSCHLQYNNEAVRQLDNYIEIKKEETLPKLHPQLNINISSDNCFGCHSRSGRISTNYEGWHETLLNKEDIEPDDKYRILEDGRVFEYVQEDVHHEKGMECIDCHNSYELMGDGKYYLHKEAQVKIQCIDCHLVDKPQFVMREDLDAESKKIADIKKYDQNKFLKKHKSGIALLNTFVRNDSLLMISKFNGKEQPLKPAAFACTEGTAHDNMSCVTCHSSWTPQCVGCHTEYDPNAEGYDLLAYKETKGAWIEHIGVYLPDPPVLGINAKDGKDVVNTFMPGMVLSINTSKYPGGDDTKIFKRLYAPTFSHTIVKESRSCKSCHNNPLAIGYGRGELQYNITGSKGKWLFTPKYADNVNDGLPEDAWIGFLQERKDLAATRDYARPFNLEEQKKILTVGACLTCHKDNSKVMKETLLDFSRSLKNVSEKCVLPEFN